MSTTHFLVESSVPLRKIGQGFCGTVWAGKTGEGDVIKREDGGPGRSIEKESKVHSGIIATLEQNPPSNLAIKYLINIPAWRQFLTPSSDQWQRILPRLPKAFEPCNALISEKIEPFPHFAREAIVQRYCPGLPRETISDDGNNEHCLLRPYLGRRRRIYSQDTTTPGRPTNRFFSLRNYPLHLDQMEELGLSPSAYAVSMADALAFLYWSAKVDANDVEFVLAPPRRYTPGGPAPGFGTLEFTSDILGPHALWILDFDCCRDMTMNEDGVEQAAIAFWRNDPFYPKPQPSSHGTSDQQPINPRSRRDQQLWELFREQFLSSSQAIFESEGRPEHADLPRQLMDTIVKTQEFYAKGAAVW